MAEEYVSRRLRGRRRLAWTILWLGLAPHVVRAGPNLITNGDFETGPLGSDASGWVHRGASTPAGYNVVDTAFKHGGARSQYLRHCDIGSWDGCGSLFQVSGYNTVVPGRSYVVSAWIRKQNGANNAGWFVLDLEWYNNDAVTWENKMPNNLPLNYDWTQVTFQVTAPASGLNGPPNRLGIWLTRHTDADVWYDDISVTDATAGPPAINRSPAVFTHAFVTGKLLSGDSFTVQNSGGGTLNYSIASDVAWMTPSMTSGASSGETDTIGITYSVAGLPADHYVGHLSISDAAAANSPQLITVTLDVFVPGDFNRDGDVDQSDFSHFQNCMSGDGIIQPLVDCADARLDADSDVDQDDFTIFQKCVSGADIVAVADCALH